MIKAPENFNILTRNITTNYINTFMLKFAKDINIVCAYLSAFLSIKDDDGLLRKNPQTTANNITH